MRIQVIQGPVCFFTSIPAALVHALNLFVTATGSLVLLRTRNGDKGIDLHQITLVASPWGKIKGIMAAYLARARRGRCLRRTWDPRASRVRVGAGHAVLRRVASPLLVWRTLLHIRGVLWLVGVLHVLTLRVGGVGRVCWTGLRNGGVYRKVRVRSLVGGGV